MNNRKNVYIIAGPNGSGKTTFASKFLPIYARCPNFINADLIAEGLSPFFPRQAAIKAGKLVLQQIKEFMGRGIDFGFETTLAGRIYKRHFHELKEKGYRINLFFLWVPSYQLAMARIKDRVVDGGHDVPLEDVKRRFERSIDNFLNEYRLLADKWILFDNEGVKPQIIAREQNGIMDVVNCALFDKITERFGVEL